jgi:hypothetical protein
MTGVSRFRLLHPDHAPSDEPAAPDPEKFQHLVGLLLDVVGSVPKRGSEHEVSMRNFRSDRLELTEPLMVTLEEIDGQYLATSYDTGQYGHGFSPDSALQHLCSVVEEYYDLLLEDEGHLSPRLESHLRYLRSILRERK